MWHSYITFGWYRCRGEGQIGDLCLVTNVTLIWSYRSNICLIHRININLRISWIMSLQPARLLVSFQHFSVLGINHFLCYLLLWGRLLQSSAKLLDNIIVLGVYFSSFYLLLLDIRGCILSQFTSTWLRWLLNCLISDVPGLHRLHLALLLSVGVVRSAILADHFLHNINVLDNSLNTLDVAGHLLSNPNLLRFVADADDPGRLLDNRGHRPAMLLLSLGKQLELFPLPLYPSLGWHGAGVPVS